MSQATKRTWFVIKGLVTAEVIAFLATYRVWHKMNTEQEYRKWMYENYPSILEGFYKCAEVGGYYKARRDDYAAWNVES